VAAARSQPTALAQPCQLHTVRDAVRHMRRLRSII
jgi:hypothetical protein